MPEKPYEIIGKIVAYGGGSVAIAYGVFTFLGKKWLENIFQTRLGGFRHEKNTEIENLKYQINSLLSRVTKIHEKEFEALPEAWSKLHDALEIISWFTSPFQQYPDLNRMSDEEINHVLENCDLQDFQKEELKNKKDKTGYYKEKIFWANLNKSRNIYSEFHKYITRNRIFLSSDLRENFMKVDGILWESLIKREVGEEAKDNKMIIEAYRDIREQVQPIILEIEQQVQERLRYSDAG